MYAGSAAYFAKCLNVYHRTVLRRGGDHPGFEAWRAEAESAYDWAVGNGGSGSDRERGLAAIARGRDFEDQILLVGGVSLNPAVRRFLAQELELSPERIVVPEHNLTLGAIGAALRGEGEVNLSEALRLLQEAPGVSAHRDRSTIVAAGAERATIPGLVTSLASAGVRIYRVVPQDAPLEDIYFALHSEQEVSS